MKRTFEQEKDRVLEWMIKYCLGYKKARKRSNILPFISLNDWKFRAIVSELKHSGDLASTSSRGYWAVPLCTNSHCEISAVLESISEMQRKALTMLQDCSKLKERFNGQRQKQKEMAL